MDKDSQTLSKKQEVIEAIQKMDESVSIQIIHQEIAKMDDSVWKNPISKYFFIGVGIFATCNFLFLFISLCTENYCVSKYSHTHNVIRIRHRTKT
jgi:hypothetical protein